MTPTKFYRRATDLFVAILIFLVAFDYWPAYGRLEFYIFQTRDLHRAAKILSGEPIFFGPEMTGGGNLPGPLYYYILAPALAIWPTWLSAWYTLIAMLVLASLVGWWLCKRHFAVTGAALWLVLFLLSGQTRRFLQIFLNVSYLLPLAAAAVILACEAYGPGSEQRRQRSFWLCCLLVGLGLQLHFSIAALFVGLVALQVLAPPLHLPRLSRKAFAFGVGALLLPSLPFLIWLTSEKAGLIWAQQPALPGNLELAPASLIQLLRAFPLELHNVMHVTACAFPLVLALILAAVFIVRDREAPPLSGGLMKPALVLAVVSFFPFAYGYFVPIGHRYAMPFYLTVLVLTVDLFQTQLRGKRIIVFNLLAGAAFLIMSGYFLVEHVEHMDWAEFGKKAAAISVVVFIFWFVNKQAAHLRRQTALALFLAAAVTFMQSKTVVTGGLADGPVMMPTQNQWRPILTKIYLETGWERTALLHVYFINHHLEQDPRPFYQSLVNLIGRVQPTQPEIDGYFVSVQKSGKDLTKEKAATWLLEQNIPPEIKTALTNGELVLLPPEDLPELVVPYKVVRPLTVPRFFHNLGEGYDQDPFAARLDSVPETSGAFRLHDGSLLFKWNECPGHPAFCSTGAFVNVTQQGGETRVHVLAVGSPISQNSPWVIPAWTQAWIEPYIEVKCGEETKKFTISSAIGFTRQYAFEPSHALIYGNHSFVAPFGHSFEVNCRKPISEISVGRASSSVETIYEVKKLPAQRLSFAL